MLPETNLTAGKAQKSKELKKNKAQRKETRDTRAVFRDTRGGFSVQGFSWTL